MTIVAVAIVKISQLESFRINSEKLYGPGMI